MNRTKRQLAAVVAVLLLVGCASVGTGRPEVVRAEDVLVNSQNTWRAFMSWHKANSTKESPAVYKILESARVEYPKARVTLRSAIRAYKAGSGDADAMLKARLVVEAIIKSLNDAGVI